jgi:hypothetical protein
VKSAKAFKIKDFQSQEVLAFVPQMQNICLSSSFQKKEKKAVELPARGNQLRTKTFKIPN